VTWLTLGHGKANLMDLESCTGIAQEMEALAQGVGPVVITGTGRIFSAGVDLRRILDGGADYIAAFLPALERMLRATFELPRPLVAALNGHAIAGGCVLACAADLTLMADGGGRIGVPELAVGVPFPPMALNVMTTRVPPHKLRQVILAAATHPAEEALALGLVDRVVTPDTLTDAAQAAAVGLGQTPASVYAATKRALIADAIARVDGGSLGESIELWCSEPVLTAIRTYVAATLSGR